MVSCAESTRIEAVAKRDCRRIEDVELSKLHPKKAFILSALDKEVRLSFARRIRETLPQEYHPLIPATKDNDIPEYKYNIERASCYPR